MRARPNIRRIGLAVLAGVVLGTVGGVAAGAQSGECAPGTGITVVVDFGALGGDVVVGCAPSPTTGFEALAQAGFSVTQVQSSPDFVCRIDGLPDTDDCVDVPPADAFWSYWVADLGGAWSFSQTGAAGPIAGDVEGWSFDGSQPPRFTPPPAPTTTTTTTTTPPTATTTRATITPATTSTSTTSTSTTSTSTTSTSTTSTITTSTTTTNTTTPPTTTTPATPPTTLPATTTEAGPSVEATPETELTGPVGVVVGAIVIASLAGAGFFLSRRRLGDSN